MPDCSVSISCEVLPQVREYYRLSTTVINAYLQPILARYVENLDSLLAEAGVKYIGDWPYDDEPTEISTAHGPLVTLPYPVELNDIPVVSLQHHPPEYFLQKTRDAFDRLYAESAARPKFMSIAFHPYLSGTPHQIRYLEAALEYAAGHPGVAFWSGEQILRWYRS